MKLNETHCLCPCMIIETIKISQRHDGMSYGTWNCVPHGYFLKMVVNSAGPNRCCENSSITYDDWKGGMLFVRIRMCHLPYKESSKRCDFLPKNNQLLNRKYKGGANICLVNDPYGSFLMFTCNFARTNVCYESLFIMVYDMCILYS